MKICKLTGKSRILALQAVKRYEVCGIEKIKICSALLDLLEKDFIRKEELTEEELNNQYNLSFDDAWLEELQRIILNTQWKGVVARELLELNNNLEVES